MIEASLFSETPLAPAMKNGGAQDNFPHTRSVGGVTPVEAEGLAALFGLQLMALASLEGESPAPLVWPGAGSAGAADEAVEESGEGEIETLVSDSDTLELESEKEKKSAPPNFKQTSSPVFRAWIPAAPSVARSDAAAAPEPNGALELPASEVAYPDELAIAEEESSAAPRIQAAPARRQDAVGERAADLDHRPSPKSGTTPATDANETVRAQVVENPEFAEKVRSAATEGAASDLEDESPSLGSSKSPRAENQQRAASAKASEPLDSTETEFIDPVGSHRHEKNIEERSVTILKRDVYSDHNRIVKIATGSEVAEPARPGAPVLVSPKIQQTAAAPTSRSVARTPPVDAWTERLQAVDPPADDAAAAEHTAKRAISTSFPHAGEALNPPAARPATRSEKLVEAAKPTRQSALQLESDIGGVAGESADTGGDSGDSGDSEAARDDRRPPERRLRPEQGLEKSAAPKSAESEGAEPEPAARSAKPASSRGPERLEQPRRTESQPPTQPADLRARTPDISFKRPIATTDSAPTAPTPTGSSVAASAAPILTTGPSVRAAEPQPTSPATPQPAAGERVEPALQVAASEVRRSGDATQLTVRIEDDRLGSLALRIAERSGGVEVMLRTDNAAAAKQFQSNLPHLYESLFQRGLQPDARAWSPAATADSDRRHQDQQQRERGSRQHGQGRRGRQPQEQKSFILPVS